MGETCIEFTLDQIKAMLPHRYPFLMIDYVKDVVPDKSATGVKNVTVNEPYFRGLPQDRLFVPGSLIIEAMAQTAAVTAIHTLGGGAAGKFIYFMGLRKFRARRPVRPGDQLLLHMAKERAFGPTSKVRGEARVDGALVAQAYLTAMILDYDSPLP
jgi:3-hydroxyacyl-[acyl-carrier-protein] dehydratase